MKKILLKIDGMTCSACSSGLEKYLKKQNGINDVTVNLIMNNANIEYDEKTLDLKQIEKFIEKAGFTSLGIDNFQKEEKKKSNEKYKLIIITITSLLTLYINLIYFYVTYGWTTSYSILKYDGLSYKLCNFTFNFNNNCNIFWKGYIKKWLQKPNTCNSKHGHACNDRSIS